MLETTGAITSSRFRRERVIGRGALGLVYRGTQLGANRAVALKLLHPDALETMDEVRRFTAEARLLATLKHPHIAETLDHGLAGEQPWIASELLSAPVTKDGLSWREALTMAVQVAGALEEGHRQGIVHRDVKPANVLRAADGSWKVTDFGLAKWTRQSPAYRAPELVPGAKPSPWSDQYALAAMLRDLLGGKSGAPPGVATCLGTALATDPRARYRAVADFGAELRQILESGPLYTPSGARAIVRPVHVLSTGAIRPPSMFRHLWKPSVVAVAALIVGLALGPLRQRSAPAPAPSVAPRPRPASRLSAAEPAEIREQLIAVLARHLARAERTKALAVLMNPLFPRFADAAPEVAALESETRTDQRMLTMLRERVVAYYPNPELVPDEELALVARVLINAARGWCWLENFSSTRETVDAALAAQGDEVHAAKVIDEMDAKSYSAGGEVYVIESVRALSEALSRMEAAPRLMTPEMGDLVCELYWLASTTNYRSWPAEAESRLREVARVLGAHEGPLSRVARTVWQLGSVKRTPLKPARESAHRAILALSSSNLPHARAIAERIERELETGKATSSPAPARAPAPHPAPDPRARPR